MFKLMVDTCVWLDLAKDHRQLALLDALEELIRQGRTNLLVPEIIASEFERNKARIADEGVQSFASALKRAKEAVNKLADDKAKRQTIAQLDEIDFRLPRLGDAAMESIGRIETLLTSSGPIPTSDSVLIRAATRAIERRAPFHRQRNGIDDAILIETYFDCITDRSATGVRFGFVTHNTKDFSHPSQDNRLPHPDLSPCFSKIKSRYFITLADALQKIDPTLVMDARFEREWAQQPRRLAEIVDALDELWDQIWYGRHQVLRDGVESGRISLVEKETFPVRDHLHRPMQHNVWKMAQAAAQRVERRRGRENLGPWTDFEWGMLNGKMSALRWVMGDDWDFLDT